MAGPSCGATGSGHEWSRRQWINRLGARQRTCTACDGVPVFLKSRRGRRQRTFLGRAAAKTQWEKVLQHGLRCWAEGRECPRGQAPGEAPTHQGDGRDACT